MTRQFSAVIIVIILGSAAVLAVVQNRKGATTISPKNTNTNTNASEPLALSISDVIAGAARYNNTALCLTAWYQNSFEFSAMAESVRIVDGQKVPSEPFVWVTTSVPETLLTCTTNTAGQNTCLGVVTSCGTFEYAAPGETGFGHTAAYRYQLRPSAPIKNTPNVNIDTLINTTNTAY